MGMNKTLKPGQGFKVGKDVEVKIISVYGTRVSIDIDAPANCRIENLVEVISENKMPKRSRLLSARHQEETSGGEDE